MLAGKAVVTDAKSFYTCAKAASSGIEVLHIPASDIEREKEMLDMRWQNCASLPQTQSVHFVEAQHPYVICSKKYSSDTKETVFDFKEGVQITAPSGDSKICTQRAMAINDSSSTVAAGQYVLVKIETKRKQIYQICQCDRKY